jgi:hypothetical protein
MITLDSKKIHDLLVMKDEIVDEGRIVSKKIEAIEKKAKVFEDKEKELTAKIIPPKDITDRGDVIVKQIQKLDKELADIIKEINESKLNAVPTKMKEEHLQLLKDKEVLERDRNKLALKVQKVKDKVIPLVQKEVKPLLGEYDDIETAKVKDGKVVITTFNRLEEWKANFK